MAIDGGPKKTRFAEVVFGPGLAQGPSVSQLKMPDVRDFGFRVSSLSSGSGGDLSAKYFMTHHSLQHASLMAA